MADSIDLKMLTAATLTIARAGGIATLTGMKSPPAAHYPGTVHAAFETLLA
jgi:hypothetical protein